ncbi:putative mitochondrial fission protein [Myxozyma melibiosi]|uniref:Mitochondrial fission protein n=1 Tax=Myxozyma melibiosi TaxID=54550 RepID=A0ABR1F002_9ASCO
MPFEYPSFASRFSIHYTKTREPARTQLEPAFSEAKHKYPGVCVRVYHNRIARVCVSPESVFRHRHRPPSSDMSSSYFDIDDLPGPSNRRSNKNREIYIAAADSGLVPGAPGVPGELVQVGQGQEQEGKEHIQEGEPSNLMSPGIVPSMPNIFMNGAGDDATQRLLQFQNQQLHYNENRTALGRAITTVMAMLKELQAKNHVWPAHYPRFGRSAPPELPSTPPAEADEDEGIDLPDRPNLRRAATEVPSASARANGKGKAIDETPQTPPSPASGSDVPPRLMSSELLHEFNVLKLDLKLGTVSPAQLVQSLEKTAVASLLDGKIAQALKHLLSLRERIEDTASKVLITGDLNAGKSTFCNALLRRNLLPEDQQPCTNVFCEVLDAQINNGVEEVHAIPHGSTYSIKDERTYDVFPLDALERLAVSPETYVLLKVYIEDKRPAEESLLRNGVVDIALIDAPGLNMDSMQTTAVFARQEEIDVVVFVVSAENHFTLSAKEFIWNAAHEKAFIFIVVNRFDNIKDKGRCSRLILEQVSKLSPQTYDDAEDLVHFVSSNKVPIGSSGGSPDDDGDDDNNNDRNNNDDDDLADFDRLERCLRNFVLEKRAISKLAPAKTYLLNLLGDVEALGSYNEDVSRSEVARLKSELEQIAPVYESTLASSVAVSEEADAGIEKTVSSVYEHTRFKLEDVIKNISDVKHVEYPGLLFVYSYASDMRDAMLVTLQQSVLECEEFARKKTTSGFNVLKGMGLQHFQGTPYYTEKVFNSSMMFSRKKDLLARGSVSADIELADFFELDQSEKLSSMGMSLTLATVAGTGAFGVPTTFYSSLASTTSAIGFRNLKNWIMPALTVALFAGVVYFVREVPNVVPRKIAKKLHRELVAVDYVHANAERIASECRKVLKFPSEDLRRAFQAMLDEQATQKSDRTRQIAQAEDALRYFARVHKEAANNRVMISKFDLESVPVESELAAREE